MKHKLWKRLVGQILCDLEAMTLRANTLAKSSLNDARADRLDAAIKTILETESHMRQGLTLPDMATYANDLGDKTRKTS